MTKRKPTLALYTLTVANEAKGEKLILQFTDRDVMTDAMYAIRKAGGSIIEENRCGTVIERTAEGALETAKLWLRLD